MIEIWFAIVCFTIVSYVILDGWNIGSGAVMYFVARTQEERRTVIHAIGPLWSWHEVWLLAAGGTLFAAFPRVLATAFAGFYLALFLVMWCLLIRGISIEFRNHVDDSMWRTGWDFAFSVSSLLLAVLLGAAGGNVIRGLPLGESGKFSMAFFTDFTTRGNVGILDWYTIAVALFALICLSAHGVTYLAFKTEGVVNERSSLLSRRLWWLAILLLPVISGVTWMVRPELFQGMLPRPAAWLGILLIIGGIATLVIGTASETRRFFGGCAVLAGLLGTAAASLFPSILHSTLDPKFSITAYNGASGTYGLSMALIWWPVALLLSVSYFVFVFRHYAGKTRPLNDPHSPY